MPHIKHDFDQCFISDKAWKGISNSVHRGYINFCKKRNIPILDFRASLRADIKAVIGEKRKKKLDTKAQKVDKFLDKVDQEFPVEYF